MRACSRSEEKKLTGVCNLRPRYSDMPSWSSVVGAALVGLCTVLLSFRRYIIREDEPEPRPHA